MLMSDCNIDVHDYEMFNPNLLYQCASFSSRCAVDGNNVDDDKWIAVTTDRKLLAR